MFGIIGNLLTTRRRSPRFPIFRTIPHIPPGDRLGLATHLIDRTVPGLPERTRDAMLLRHRLRLTGVIVLGICIPAEIVVSPVLDSPSPRTKSADDGFAAVVSPPKSLDTTASRQTTRVTKVDVAGSERPAPATRLLEPEVDSTSIDYAAVERLRRSDSRYARLDLDVRDGRIVIACTDGNPDAAWELAGKITPHVGGREILVRPGKQR